MRAQCVREILSLCDGFYPAFKSTEGRNEYFFNRNPTCFNSILDIYRMGKLHCNKTSCALSYLDDIEYWGFNEFFLDPCCAIDYYVEKDACQKELEGEMAANKKVRIRLNEEEFGSSCIGKLRKYVWNITEYPETSIWARVDIYIIIYYSYINAFNRSLHFNPISLRIHIFLFSVVRVRIFNNGFSVNDNFYSSNDARARR